MGVYLDFAMRYRIIHHQHKGKPFEKALKRSGWREDTYHPEICLMDHAINRGQPEKGRRALKSLYNQRITVVTYPHGATGAWWMDSDIFNTDPRVSGNLVIGEGHKRIEQIMQPTLDHYVVGWPYCKVMPFDPPNKLKTILFAPIHASIRGNLLRQEAIDTNIAVYKELLSLPYRIKVRHVNPLDVIGLWKEPNVEFIFGQPDGSYIDIDKADLVIAEGTFLYLAAARGKPVIGLNQHIPIGPSYEIFNFKLNHWDEYEPYFAYPIDFSDGPLKELIELAIEEEQIEWKRLFIGKEMKDEDLVKILTEIRLKDLKTSRI